jgi:hypothetical protein
MQTLTDSASAVSTSIISESRICFLVDQLHAGGAPVPMGAVACAAVTGVDLTPEFVETPRMTRRAGCDRSDGV